MKKIMALMVAVSMALSMASCANSDNGDTTSNTTQTQTSTVSEISSQTVTEAEDKSVDVAESVDESSQEEAQSDDETVEGEFKVTEDNLFVFYNAPEYKPTKEELIPIAQLAVAHYDTARIGDWKAYLDTINYDGLINAPSFRALAEYDEEQTENMSPGLDMASFYLFYTLVCNYAEEKYGDEYKDDTLAEYIDSVTRAWNEITDEEAEKMVTYGFGAYRYFTEVDSFLTEFDENYERDLELDVVEPDSVVYLWIEECDKIDDDLYISMNVKIYSNERIYDLPLVCAWRANGQYGIMSQTLRYFDTTYPGMTGAEIMAALEAGDPGINPKAEESEAETEEGETETEEGEAETEE